MIEKLPEYVVQQIAAGEVIERPASAVKELIENSLDAGATKIEVTYEEGGLQSLSVRDNGGGISFEELALVFEAHATSKLKSFQDLMQLSTLGFRGEALSSMASVARVSLSSTAKGSEMGGEIQSIHGQIHPAKEAEPLPGTRIQIESLFENLPARHKFLKSSRAEAMAIQKVVRRYALAFAHCHWILKDSKKETKFDLPPSSALERAAWFFDEKNLDQWLEIKSKDGPWSLYWVGIKPTMIRGGRGQSEIFVNERPILDRRLEVAVKRGFEGYTEYPQSLKYALYLNGPSDKMDVNIHPTKTEIKFLNADPLFSFIVKSIRRHLEKLHLEDSHSDWQKNRQSSVENDGQEQRQRENLNDPKSFFQSGSSRSQITRRLANQWTDPPSGADGSPSGAASREILSALKDSALPSKNSLSRLVTQSPFVYLGSVDSTYIVAKKESDLFLFDQHALHERVLYEALWQDYQAGKIVKSQRLLLPYVLKGGSWGDLLEQEEALQKLGFEIRQTPSQKLEIVSAPAILKGRYEEVLAHFLEESTDSEQTMLRNRLATMACHSALRAHDPLAEEKAHYLLEAFGDREALGHCPHGRPTYVKLKTSDLEKMFFRK